MSLTNEKLSYIVDNHIHMNCGSPGGGTLGHHMQQQYVAQQQSVAQQQMTQAQYNHMVNQQLQQIQQGVNHGNWPAGTQVYSGATGTYGSGGGGGAGGPSACLPSYISWANAQDPTTWTREPLKSAGIKVGEIVGWRIWTIKGNYLKAYGVDHVWAPGENMEGEVPDYGYEGIWSFKKKGDAIKKLLENPSPHAFGSIKMWGDVVEHTIGYRAQFAKIVSLDDVQPSDNKLLQTLRENYGLCQQSSSIQKPPDCPMPKEAPLTASQKLLSLLQLKPMTD